SAGDSRPVSIITASQRSQANAAPTTPSRWESNFAAGVIGSPQVNPITALEMGEVQTAARTLGLHLVTLEIRRPEDILPAFEMLKSDAQALYVAGDPLVLANRVRINTLALVARLPAFYNERAYVEAGGLMSYGVNWPDLFRRTAELVDKI